MPLVPRVVIRGQSRPYHASYRRRLRKKTDLIIHVSTDIDEMVPRLIGIDLETGRTLAQHGLGTPGLKDIGDRNRREQHARGKD